MKSFVATLCSLASATLLCHAAAGQTVEFQIVERTGQTQVTPTGDTTLDFAVQARVVGGPAGSSIAGFSFDITLTNEPESSGTLAKGLINNADGTYSGTFGVTATVGRGGMAAAYTYLAGLSPNFNGLINSSAGPFTNNPNQQEIGLITGLVGGSSLLAVPGIDPTSTGNPATWAGPGAPANGDTAAIDPTVGAAYFGTGGGWIDVYRFRYTVTNFTSRTISATLANTAAQTFTQFSFANGSWAAPNTIAQVSVAGVNITVGTPGSCCVSGQCSLTLDSGCSGTFAAGGTCTPNPCVQPSGSCCNASTGGCTLVPLASCTGGNTWTQGGVCSPNPCPQPQGSCCAASGACTHVVQATCTSGTWTQGGVCFPNPCAQPQGVCCNSSTGGCALTVQTSCTVGSWTQGGVCSPNPCPPPSGQCCNFITGSCALTVQSACGLASHTWASGGSCSPNPCPPSGACCTPAGACTRTTASRCAGTSAWTQGRVCSPNPCVLNGACCNVSNGSCSVQLLASCGLAGHTWNAGGACSPNPCPVTGACCTTATGACRRTIQARCTSGSTWRSGGVCSPNPCSNPLGICCNFITGSCAITDQPSCGLSSHTWATGGVCSPNPCPPVGACCTAGTCRRLTQSKCSALTGLWTIAGVCSPNPCPLPILAGGQPVPGCVADYNASGTVDIADLMDFLSAWFSGAAGDSVQSVFDFMQAWFTGCP